LLNDKLQTLLEEKKRERAEDTVKKQNTEKQEHEEHIAEEEMIQGGYTGFITEPPGILDREQQAEKEIISEEEQKEQD
jgi:hypothetical protein